jgi:phenylacetate-CoA ligase
MTSITPEFERFRSRFQAEMLARLPEHVQRLGWSAERIAEHQRAGLRRILAHALERSPFHARRLRGVDPARVELADLARLPVMTKAEMMDAFDEVVTDRRLSRGRVEDVLARTRETPIPLDGEYVCQASGGSSGRRGVFVLDIDAMVDFASSLMRPTLRHGLPTEPLTIGMVAAPSAVHPTGIPATLMEGSPTRYVATPATLPIPEIVDRLNALQPTALLAYASMLARLAVERKAGRLRIAPAVVRSTSETLLPEQRAVVSEAFGVPLMDTFGSSEGLVGVSEPDDPVITFASDLCIVEPVDERDRPVPPGEPSARILVTNLCNRVQPLVRYAIEDTFVCQPAARHHGHLRATVRGRADDVLHYGGFDVHPIAIRAVMVKTPAVTDYQVRQTSRGIDVALVADGSLDPAWLCDRLREALADAGLESPTVTARVVPALERQPGTGKLRRFVPL